jgi:hypothetical protein
MCKVKDLKLSKKICLHCHMRNLSGYCADIKKERSRFLHFWKNYGLCICNMKDETPTWHDVFSKPPKNCTYNLEHILALDKKAK